MEQISSSLFFLFSFFLLNLRVRARLTLAAARNLTSGDRSTIPCNQSIIMAMLVLSWALIARRMDSGLDWGGEPVA
jgi:hypothetical protein